MNESSCDLLIDSTEFPCTKQIERTFNRLIVYENTVDKYRYIDKVSGPNNSYKHPWFCSKKTDPKQLEYIIGQFEQLFLDYKLKGVVYVCLAVPP